MQVTEAIWRIRAMTHDVTEEYDDADCVFAINLAAHELATTLIAGHYPGLIEEGDFREGDAVPEGFFKTAGLYPVRVTGGMVHMLGGQGVQHLRYYVLPKEVALGGVMPFRLSLLNRLTLKIAAKMLSDGNEFDISQDTGIQTEIQQALASGWAG